MLKSLWEHIKCLLAFLKEDREIKRQINQATDKLDDAIRRNTDSFLEEMTGLLENYGKQRISLKNPTEPEIDALVREYDRKTEIAQVLFGQRVDDAISEFDHTSERIRIEHAQK